MAGEALTSEPLRPCLTLVSGARRAPCRWKIPEDFAASVVPKKAMPEDILTIREVTEYLKVTERTLYRLVQEGQLPAFKVGNSWRFRRADLERWISKQARTPRTNGAN